jgi:hypothetical protein
MRASGLLFDPARQTDSVAPDVDLGEPVKQRG